MLYGRPGRMAGRLALHDDRTPDDLHWRHSVSHDLDELSAQKAIVKERFKDCGWECQAILSELDASTDLYFDRVSQVKLGTWSQGRVSLIGDAAFCVSLLAGQGSALAMTAAYVLAGSLRRRGATMRLLFNAMNACCHAGYVERLRDLVAHEQAKPCFWGKSAGERSGRLLLLFNERTLRK